MKLLVGTDGVQKMSKSVGNTIDFEDPPNEKYGKVMSLPDSALLEYLELATDVAEEELAYLAKQIEQGGPVVRDIKKRLAREIVAQFHGEAAAQEAEAEWVRVFSEKDVSAGVSEYSPMYHDVFVDFSKGGAKLPLARILSICGAVASVSEARRLIKDGAVEIDGQRHTAQGAVLLRPGMIIRVGKHRFVHVVDTSEKGKTQ